MRQNQTSQQEHEPNPGVEVGDHIYVQHRGQHCVGVVCAHGKHGATVEIDGKHHKIKWKGVLGHKKRAQANYNVVDEGEDGMLVEDAHGKRKFIAMPNEAKENPMVAKSFGRRPVALFMKGIAPRPGLTEKKLTDKRGVPTTRWVKVDRGGPQAQPGQHVGFQNGEHRGHGEVASAGKHGVTVRDQAGGEHRILHEHVTHHWRGDAAPDKSPHEDEKPEGKKPDKANDNDMPDTIEIDGKQRSTKNSDGKPIHPTVEGVKNFWKWFGDSKVVDDEGKPLVVYHSTLKDMKEFNAVGAFMGHTGVSGISVTDRPEMASRYLDRYASHGWVDGKPNQPFEKNVMPLYVCAKNPIYQNEPIKTNIPMGAPLPKGYVNPLVEKGYDALIRDDAISRKGTVKHSEAKNAIKGREIVVFDPSQIKSALGNSGDFSPDNPEITKSILFFQHA